MRHESVFPFDIGRESAKFPGQLIIPFRVSDWKEDFDDNGDFTTMVNGVKWCVGERAKYGNYARQTGYCKQGEFRDPDHAAHGGIPQGAGTIQSIYHGDPHQTMDEGRL